MIEKVVACTVFLWSDAAAIWGQRLFHW